MLITAHPVSVVWSQSMSQVIKWCTRPRCIPPMGSLALPIIVENFYPVSGRKLNSQASIDKTSPMPRISLTVVLFSVLSSSLAFGQTRTVGIFANDDDSFGGFTLMSPLFHPVTYLVNEYGDMAHKWTHDFNLGANVHLLENGNLLRASGAPDSWVVQAGQGGRLEEIEWDGTVVWQFDFVDSVVTMHHDIVPMPDGNVLTTVWEQIHKDSLDAVGYDLTELTADTTLWSEKIIEFKPIYPDSAEIVWEWSAFDHLVQDHDPAKSNYGVISDYPWKIDVNTGHGGSWLHFNALDYNEDLNIIMVSAGYFSEVWVINRNSTTEEARGQKGDLIYRFGNPQMYGVGNDDDRFLHFSHSAHWIPAGLEGDGHVLVFDNGRFLPPPQFSTILELALPHNVDYDGNVFFDIGADGAYVPPFDIWSYSDPANLYSQIASGMQRLPNGHTMILEGMNGRIIEIDKNENIVWEYVNPVIRSGPLPRDAPIPTFIPNDPNPFPILQNSLFRTYTFARDYPGLQGKDLSGKGPIELAPTAVEDLTDAQKGITLYPNYPNPFNTSTQISFSLDKPGPVHVAVYDILGREVRVLADEFRGTGLHTVSFEAENLASGLYFYRLRADNTTYQQTLLLTR